MDSEKRDGNSSGTDPQGLAEPRAPLLAVEERVQHLPVCWVPEGSPRLWVSLGRVGGQLSPTPACLGKGWAEPRETESRPSPSMSETRGGGQTERAGQDWSRGQETQEAALGGHELAEGWQGAEEDKGSRLG